MMKTQFHGITSLGLMLVASAIATVAMFQTSWMLGAVYLVVCVAAPVVILYAYCAKCPCRTHCGHVFPGKAAMVFKSRQAGPYTTTELAVVGLALLLWIGLPQVWLWQYTEMFVTYWVLSAIAIAEIRAVVCPACENVYCPVRRMGSRMPKADS